MYIFYTKGFDSLNFYMYHIVTFQLLESIIKTIIIYSVNALIWSVIINRSFLFLFDYLNYFTFNLFAIFNFSSVISLFYIFLQLLLMFISLNILIFIFRNNNKNIMYFFLVKICYALMIGVLTLILYNLFFSNSYFLVSSNYKISILSLKL